MSYDVFADLRCAHLGIERRLADARIAGLPGPVAAALARLVGVAIEAADEHDPKLGPALDGAIAVVRDPEAHPPGPSGRTMASAPRDGMAFLATGVHDRDDPPGAARGVRAGDRWWSILLYDVWRTPHRFVFSKDGQPPWSEPELWCPLPDLIPGPAAPETAVRHALSAALMALRSYQHGNASPDLAREVADVCAHVLEGEW